MLLLTFLAACATIQPDFHAARKAALADPPPLGDPWSPDLELQLSAPVVEELLDEVIALQSPLKTELKLGPAWAKPRLSLGEATVRPGRQVKGLLLDVVLDGTVRWGLGPAEGKLPASAEAQIEVAFEAVRGAGNDWDAEVHVVKVHDLSVDVAGASVGLGQLGGDVRSWLSGALRELPPMPFAVVGGDGLPLRALRVVPAGRGVRLLAKTATPVDVTVQRPKGMPAGGFRLAVHEESLLALARAASFQNGAVGYQVVPEPRGLDFTDAGFDLDLRLWRPVGRGWWRDYDIAGTADVRAKRVKLEATEVEEAGKSKGAALADALAALGEGVILRILQDALNTAVPSTTEQTIGGIDLEAAITELGPGQGRSVVVSGTAGVD